MFAKLGRFRGLGRRHAPSSQDSPCNDNHPARHAAAISRRPLRRRLVCRWRRVPPMGALECSWRLEEIASAAAGEPVIRWPTPRLRSLPGLRIMAALRFGRDRCHAIVVSKMAARAS